MPEEPTKLDDIIVIGPRLIGVPLVPGGSGGGGNDSGGPDQNEVDPNAQPSGGPTEEEADAENERQKDCAAKAFEETLEDEHQFSRNRREFFAFMWTREGNNVTHPPAGGNSEVIREADRDRARSEYGISYADVTGFIHNHPRLIYCPNNNSSEEIPNMYPSDGDIAYADQLVTPAYGVSGDQLTIYIVDCDGVTRSFRYRDRATWLAARNAGETPPPIDPECQED